MPETCRVLLQNKFRIFVASSWLFYTNTLPLKIVKMIITQTKISKNIRLQQYNLMAKELDVDMDDNTMRLIIWGYASENAVKWIRGSHMVPSLSWP
jgi:hypothetical protein